MDRRGVWVAGQRRQSNLGEGHATAWGGQRNETSAENEWSKRIFETEKERANLHVDEIVNELKHRLMKMK